MPRARHPSKYDPKYREWFKKSRYDTVSVECGSDREAVNLRRYLDVFRRVMREHPEVNAFDRHTAKCVTIRQRGETILIDYDDGVEDLL